MIEVVPAAVSGGLQVPSYNDSADPLDEQPGWEEEFEQEYYEALAREFDSPELEESTDDQPVAARREDGSLLIIAGPGAGTLSVTPNMTVEDIDLVSDRDTALSGRRPIVIVHRPYQNAAPLPRLLAEIQRVHGGDIALAVSAPLPQISHRAHQIWNSECLGAAVKLADPRGYLLDGDLLRLEKEPIKANSRKNAPYLNSPNADSWLKEVLDLQREAGANLLLTSGRALDMTAPQASLDKLCREGDDALANLKTGERLALNITIPAAWLSQPTTRDLLLSQLLDQEQFDVWHIRVQWPSPLRSWAQPVHEELLRGYKRLAELSEDEERVLLLPQTGLTGWFMQAFGAAGFGLGVSGTDNAFREFSMGRGTRIERYFENQLAHTVERTAHERMTGVDKYNPCDCRYCQALRGRQNWSNLFAALHYVLSITGMTAQAARASDSRGGRLGFVRRAVRSALAFSRDQPLLDTNVPQHLAVWDRLL